MNYGKKAIQKKIKDASSRSSRMGNKFLLVLIETLLLSAAAFVCFCVSAGIGTIKGIIDNSPAINIDSIVPQGLATTVYDTEDNVIATLVQAGSNRDPATYDELPQDLIDAFVAIEDSRFWQHNGIDIRSIVRAVKGVLTHDSSAGGGSTITQQLIKNNVFDGGREASIGETLERKFQEQYLAVQLTKTMDRKLILTNYLNTINLGNNCLGVKVAARRYFDKEVSDLTLSECAVIAGITQNPSALNPISGQKKNAEKREIILQYMLEQGYISEDEYKEAMADDVYSRIQLVDSHSRDTSMVYSYFVDELTRQVRDTLIKKLGYTETQAHNLIYSGGLRIMATQDPALQAVVDEEVNNPDNYPVTKYSVEYRLSVKHADGQTEHFNHGHIRNWHRDVLHEASFDSLYGSEEAARADIENFKAYLLKADDEIVGETVNFSLQPQVSFTLIDQNTGEVKAISGGRGQKTANLTLNRATDVPQQPGSTFKVISSFAPAIDACGATLGTVFYDAPYTVGNKTFSNWGSWNYQGYSSIREGIIYSMNIVAVRCMMERVTPQLGVEYAQNFGISTLTSTDYNASTALGGLTEGVTNLELTGAFASIANGGVYREPIFFTRILDRNGKILLDNEPETRRVLKDTTAFLLTDAMKDSMIYSRKFSSGSGPTSTSSAAHLDGMSCAGKSGTTSDNFDIWFEGFTPYYTGGIWAGCDINLPLDRYGGTSFHKAIWKKIMTRIHEGLSDPGFQQPYNIETAQICRKSGKLAIPGVCSSDGRGDATYTEYFEAGTAPTEMCDVHVTSTVCAESGLLSTEYCPEKITKVFISLPQNEAAASTDDSLFAIPGTCDIHSSSSSAPSDGSVAPGPGSYVPGPVVDPGSGPGSWPSQVPVIPSTAAPPRPPF